MSEPIQQVASGPPFAITYDPSPTTDEERRWRASIDPAAKRVGAGVELYIRRVGDEGDENAFFYLAIPVTSTANTINTSDLTGGILSVAPVVLVRHRDPGQLTRLATEGLARAFQPSIDNLLSFAFNADTKVGISVRVALLELGVELP